MHRIFTTILLASLSSLALASVTPSQAALLADTRATAATRPARFAVCKPSEFAAFKNILRLLATNAEPGYQSRALFDAENMPARFKSASAAQCLVQKEPSPSKGQKLFRFVFEKKSGRNNVCFLPIAVRKSGQFKVDAERSSAELDHAYCVDPSDPELLAEREESDPAPQPTYYTLTDSAIAETKEQEAKVQVQDDGVSTSDEQMEQTEDDHVYKLIDESAEMKTKEEQEEEQPQTNEHDLAASQSEEFEWFNNPAYFDEHDKNVFAYDKELFSDPADEDWHPLYDNDEEPEWVNELLADNKEESQMANHSALLGGWGECSLEHKLLVLNFAKTLATKGEMLNLSLYTQNVQSCKQQVVAGLNISALIAINDLRCELQFHKDLTSVLHPLNNVQPTDENVQACQSLFAVAQHN